MPWPGSGGWRSGCTPNRSPPMSMTPQDANQLAREGAADLQAGRAADARAKLERIAAAGFENPELWNLVASACRALGDAEGEEGALDRLLAIEPRAVRAI